MNRVVKFAVELGYYAAAAAVCGGAVGVAVMKPDPMQPFCHFAAGTTLGLYGGATGYIFNRLGISLGHGIVSFVRKLSNDSKGPNG